METVADVELTKAINHAQKMLDAAIEVVGAAQVKLDQSWARNPKVIALAILCRSITNFRASLILVQQQQVLEARALVRLMYENLLWLAALRERGAAFVQAMIDDEAFNRKALAKRTLKLTAKQGADLSQPGASKLKSIIEDLEQKFPKTKKARNRQNGGTRFRRDHICPMWTIFVRRRALLRYGAGSPYICRTDRWNIGTHSERRSPGTPFRGLVYSPSCVPCAYGCGCGCQRTHGLYCRHRDPRGADV